MKCKNIQNQLIDYIENNISKEEKLSIETHINSCSNCKDELENTKQFFSVLSEDKMEQPSANLKLNFEKVLAEEIENKETKVITLTPKKDWKSYIRVAASIAIVASAFLLGRYQSNQQKITAAHQQKVQQENNVLAMLENQSASKRILAVSNSEKINQPDTKIIEALIQRLYYDKNTNVRLAAAETLAKFSSQEMVKTALIKSLETEKVASVQIELIQILAKIQEKRALEPMQKLLQKEETPNYVKQELAYNIPSLL